MRVLQQGTMTCPECDGEMYLRYLIESETLHSIKEHVWKTCWYCEGAGTLPVSVERMDDE